MSALDFEVPTDVGNVHITGQGPLSRERADISEGTYELIEQHGGRVLGVSLFEAREGNVLTVSRGSKEGAGVLIDTYRTIAYTYQGHFVLAMQHLLQPDVWKHQVYRFDPAKVDQVLKIDFGRSENIFPDLRQSSSRCEPVKIQKMVGKLLDKYGWNFLQDDLCRAMLESIHPKMRTSVES